MMSSSLPNRVAVVLGSIVMLAYSRRS